MTPPTTIPVAEDKHADTWQTVIATDPADTAALHAALLAERAAYEAMIIAENTPKENAK